MFTTLKPFCVNGQLYIVQVSSHGWFSLYPAAQEEGGYRLGQRIHHGHTDTIGLTYLYDEDCLAIEPTEISHEEMQRRLMPFIEHYEKNQ